MEEENKLITNKNGLLSRIIDKIKSLFSKKSYSINEVSKKITNENYNTGKKFEDGLKVNIYIPDEKVIELQEKLENGELILDSIPDNKIKELEKMYEYQINILKNKLKCQ